MSTSSGQTSSVTIGGQEYSLSNQNQVFSVVDGNQLITGHLVNLNTKNDADQTDAFAVTGIDSKTGMVNLLFQETGKTQQVPLSAFTQAGLTVGSNENGGYFISTSSLNENMNISYLESKSFNYVDSTGKVQYASSYSSAKSSIEQDGTRILMYNEANKELPVVASVYQDGKWVSEGAMSLDEAVKKYNLTNFDLTTEGALEGADNSGAIVVVKQCLPGEHPEPKPEPEPKPTPRLGVRTETRTEINQNVDVKTEYVPTAEPIIPTWDNRLAPINMTAFKVKVNVEVPATVDSTVIVRNPNQTNNLSNPAVTPQLDNPGNSSATVQAALKNQIVPLATFNQQTTGRNSSTQFTGQATALEVPVLGFNFGGNQSLIVIARNPDQYGTVIKALSDLNQSNLKYIQGQEKPVESFKTVLKRAGLNEADFALETMATTELQKASGSVVTKTITLPSVNVDAGTLVVGPQNNSRNVGVEGVIAAPGNSTINNTSLSLGQRVTDPSVLQQISASDPLARYILDMHKKEILEANPQPTGFPVYGRGKVTPSGNGRNPQTFENLYEKK